MEVTWWFCYPGRPEQEQLGRQRAGPGQRGRRVRGAARRHGRGLRHRRGRVRLEGAQGGRGGAGEGQT